jgi:DNA-binding protein HU-beta
MNKAQLVEEVSGKTRLTKKGTQNGIDTMMETIRDTLSRAEKVHLVGFGTFQVANKKNEKRSESSNRSDYSGTGKEGS